jgi:hypothetical protein
VVLRLVRLRFNLSPVVSAKAPAWLEFIATIERRAMQEG